MESFEDSYGKATARYYDAAYGELGQANLGPDVDFYRELALEAEAPVLELGCGTGRVLLALARAGVDCTGVDASDAMLEALRAKAPGPGPTLVRARMQDFDLGEARFGLIFSAFRAFQHLYSVEEQLACLARVRKHLAPGGRFAFDVFNPSPARTAVEVEPEVEDVRFPWEGDEVSRNVSVRRDLAEQMLDVRMRYDRIRGGRVIGSEETRFRMRWFWRFELEHLLHRAGFEDVVVHGDFDRSAVGVGSPALIVVAGA